MANRRFGESKKEYKIRLKREEMEASTHIKTRQGLFESNHAYEKRVNRQALENIAESSGINLFESDEHYNRRIKLDALNKNPSLVKLLGLDEDN